MVFDQSPKISKCRAVSRTFEDLKTKTVLSEWVQAPNNLISGPIVPGESRNAPNFLRQVPQISGFSLNFTAEIPIPLSFPYAHFNRVEYCSHDSRDRIHIFAKEPARRWRPGFHLTGVFLLNTPPLNR